MIRSGGTRSWPAALAAPVASMLGVLGSLATALALQAGAGLPSQVSVLAVVLTLSLRRIRVTSMRAAVVAAVELAVVGLAAGGAGYLLRHDLWVGAPLLVLGLSVGIFARRYPPPVNEAGRLVGLPFVALLVTPAPGGDHGSATVLWAPLIAVIALAWATLGRRVVESVASAVPVEPPPPVPVRRPLDGPTRMALQMVVGLGVALVLGVALFGDRWNWTLLSAFLVASGNRGRGDVVHKAGLRIIGGVAGTAVATLLAGAVPSGHRSTLVALFVVMFAGLVLRTRSYAWWAAAVTAMVALLHGYYGQTGATVLADRLLGIALGSAIGVAAAWFVTPVRTRDVVRRRLFDCLAALTDDLAPDADPDAPAYRTSVARLNQVAPALRAHRRTVRRAAPVHAIDAVSALHELTLPTDPDARRRLRAATVWVRRSAAGRDVADPPALPDELATVHRVLVDAG